MRKGMIMSKLKAFNELKSFTKITVIVRFYHQVKKLRYIILTFFELFSKTKKNAALFLSRDFFVKKTKKNKS